MAGNARFDLTSASPESSLVGNYQNGQRGYSAPTLDRSASFRESTENRSFGSGKANSRGSINSLGDVPSLSQCLNLEPIVLGDQKYARPSDLRRILGFSAGNGSEETSVATHSKNSPPGSVEELKRARALVADSCAKASGRAKKLDDNLNKLNKLHDIMPSKKQQRNELLVNERCSSSTFKIGSQMHRNASEVGSQKVDDRPKNVSLNKRLRTSVAEPRVEHRNIGMLRQPLLVTKERDLLKDNNIDAEVAEEKIRRLPVAGEGWDRKMKKKRSVGAVFSRSVDNDGELPRTMHHKLTSESGMQSSDSAHGFRSGASGGSNRLESTSSPAGSTSRTSSKGEQDKVLSRDLSTGPPKERAIGKVNVKLNNREDNHSMCPSPVVKRKASRAPRSGSMVAANSAVNVPRVSGALESWEQPSVLNKTPSIGGTINRKRAMPAGPSSQPITQWVGQRPHKISRTRRTNLIPVSSHDETPMQSEGCLPSDFGMRSSTGATNASLASGSAAHGNQNLKVKLDNVPSPVRLSESEESGAGKARTKEKGTNSGDAEELVANAGQSVGPSAIPIKKNKILATEEIGDGVRRQGRTGRVSPFSRSSISPTREKLDNAALSKPLRIPRSGSDKNGSKSGRPLKKLSDRKGFSRLSHVAKGLSPDCSDISGESEDDHEDLLAAANRACNSSLDACSSAFWRTVEALFASIGPDDKSYLSEQLKLAEEFCSTSSQSCSNGNNAQEDYACEETATHNSLSCRTNKSMISETNSKDDFDRMEFVEQLQNSSIVGCADGEKGFDTVTPIYQRVLSALISEDEIEESEETGFGISSSVNNSCLLNVTESHNMDRLEYCEPIFGVRAQRNGNAHIIVSCNGNTNFDRSPSAHDRLCNGDILPRGSGYMHSEVEVLVRFSRCNYGHQNMQANNFGISSFNCPYEQMSPEEKIVLELQSLDLFLEAVPSLDDKEDEMISQKIAQLERGLHEQTVKKKTCLDRISKSTQENVSERRDPEQVAMDKLVELAYKKLLATRGSFASKHGISKVSKQVALAFARRTLARCRKFEDSGVSCFLEPALRDVVYATPPRVDDTELLNGVNLAVANGGHILDPFEKSGPLSNRGKRKEVFLDDVSGSAFRASSALGISGGTKGKRSERDASTRNAFAKAGRSSVGGSKGERKTKSKPKHRTAQICTPGNGFVNKFTDSTNSAYPSGSGSGESPNNSGNRKRDVRFMSSGNIPPVTSKETKQSMDFPNLPLNGIDGIEELGVDTDTGAPQDLNSWFDFNVDGLPDHDSVGLEIPMDDLSELNMF